MKKPDLAWLNSAKEKLLPLLRRYRALLIVLLAGVLLLASGGLSGGGQPAQTAAPADAESEDEGFSLSAFEADLNEKLAAIDGVGRVQLMLSLEPELAAAIAHTPDRLRRAVGFAIAANYIDFHAVDNVTDSALRTLLFGDVNVDTTA